MRPSALNINPKRRRHMSTFLDHCGGIDKWQKTRWRNLHMWFSHLRALIGSERLKDFLAHMHLITWGCALKFREARGPHTCDSVSFCECWCDSEWQIGMAKDKSRSRNMKRKKGERRARAESNSLAGDALSFLHGLLINHWGPNRSEYIEGIMQSADGGMVTTDSTRTWLKDPFVIFMLDQVWSQPYYSCRTKVFYLVWVRGWVFFAICSAAIDMSTICC